MKSFFKETGKAIAYFAIYLLMQVVATIGVSFLFEFKLGYEAGASGKTDMENFQEIAAKAGEMTMHNMGLVLIINAILAIAIYVIIAKCRNKSFMEEASIKRISVNTVLLSFITAVGCTCFFTYGMELLPIPDGLVEGMVKGNAQLADIPVWQSIAATSIIVPILEEIVFRGFVFSRLNRVMSTWIAVVITSILFGMVHGQLLWAVWAAAMGVVFNIVRIKTDSIIPSIIMHIANNSYSTILSLTGTSVPDRLVVPIVIIGAVLLSVALVLISKNADNGKKAEVEVVSVSM